MSLDRWLLESDTLFRTLANYYFLNLLLDSKDFPAFLRIGKHFEKMIRPQNFGEKTVAIFVYFQRGKAARRLPHQPLFLRAVRKLYKATLNRPLVAAKWDPDSPEHWFSGRFNQNRAVFFWKTCSFEKYFSSDLLLIVDGNRNK